MAEEKKTTTRGRKPKTEEVVVEKDIEKELEEAKAEKDAMANLLKQMQEQMALLQAQINQPQVVIQQQTNDSLSRNVKVISMLNNNYTLSTLPNCKGTVVRFTHYGEIKMIKFTDLQSMIQLYTHQFEQGMVVLGSKKDYDDLGLGYVYDEIINKEKMDKVILLEDDSDVDIILGMSDTMLENVLRIISEKYVDGYAYDLNRLRVLQYETDINDYIDSYREEKEMQENMKEE